MQMKEEEKAQLKGEVAALQNVIMKLTAAPAEIKKLRREENDAFKATKAANVKLCNRQSTCSGRKCW